MRWTWRPAPARRTAKVDGRAAVMEPKLMLPYGAHILTSDDRPAGRDALDQQAQAWGRFGFDLSWTGRVSRPPRCGFGAGPASPGASDADD